MRAGQTLMELVIVIVIVGVLAGIAVPRVQAATDQAMVRGAATELVAILGTARAAAQRRDALAVASFDSATVTARVLVGSDTLLVRALGAELGVTLRATRDSVTYGPSGRGYGAANTSLIVRRGGATDTVFVSRLGRVRRARGP
jgi:prepilin-type N-terminal cleavage/methylation domain-containing protein